MAVRKNLVSPRELEVLKLIAEGKQRGEIAQKMGIQIRTVSYFVERLYAKADFEWGDRCWVLLVRWGIREKLIEA